MARFLPHGLIAGIAALLVLYAFGVLTATLLFRGVLAICGFTLLAVVILAAKPLKKAPAVPPPGTPFMATPLGTAEEDIRCGDTVEVNVTTGGLRRHRPLPTSFPSGPVQ